MVKIKENKKKDLHKNKVSTLDNLPWYTTKEVIKEASKELKNNKTLDISWDNETEKNLI